MNRPRPELGHGPTASVSNLMTQPSPTAAPRTGATADFVRADDGGGMNQGFRVLSSLIAGVLIYGGLGWLGDYALHTHFLVAIGVILGAGLGVYTTIRRLWKLEAQKVTEGAR